MKVADRARRFAQSVTRAEDAAAQGAKRRAVRSIYLADLKALLRSVERDMGEELHNMVEGPEKCCCQCLGEHERKVVEAICARLRKGFEAYGPLDPNDGRKWRDEASEELLDAVVYLTLETLP